MKDTVERSAVRGPKRHVEDLELGLRRKQMFKELKLKHADRKLIVSNIPLDCSKDELEVLFTTALGQLMPGRQLLAGIEVAKDHSHAVLEFADKTGIETCLLLNGTEYRGRNLKVQRHKKYISERAYEIKKEIREREKADRDTELIMNSNPFPNHENRIFMGNLPTNLPEEDIRRMVESFGRLKNFSLAKTSAVGGHSRGFCFFEYADPKITDKAIEQLNQLDIGDKRIKVQRAAQQTTQSSALALPGPYKKKKFSDPLFKCGPSGILSSLDPNKLQQIQTCFSFPVYAVSPSRCIMMLNLFRAEDLVDEWEFHDIYNDIWYECQRQGHVEALHIPRPNLDTLEVPHNIGKAYVRFYDVVSAKKARHSLAGKTFNRRTVIVAFYPESWFTNREFI